ncbi:DUF2130 domain-containing protein [Autumnicola musiva]|uniref:DUF2130 domain-containing protein n=1 Tax=Autumnicola musiva TaxID=3075589 RepID=A0ABU3D652_9FLAO|nr:DUF2130 domain-containing protein [Zunongwangia sp. F117]MDT0677008.1 DUF2130 domain-containing protein [Zunongwangia sp. F117]
MKNQTTINCPECGSEINVNDILKHQIEDAIRSEFQQKQNQANKKLKAEQDNFIKEKEEFEAKKERENELFKERLEKEKKEAEKKIEEKLKAKLEEEQIESNQELQKELNEKTEKLKELYKKDAEISRLQREKSEMKDALEAETEKRIAEMMSKEREKIRKQEDEKNELKFKELEKQLDQQKKLTEEMRRKQEQGSMQLQGEVQELAIEEWLATNFPLDNVEEIRKGANGADCFQTVNTYEAQNCGSIYYESKRAKNFSNAWVSKFKDDMAKKGATLGVLVTEVLPNGMERMGMIDKSLWVCTYQEFKGLSAVLRQGIITVNNAVVTQSNKGDKMSLLYDYLVGPEFRMQIEAIKDAFIEMQQDLEKEQRVAHSRWKRRQKQIEKVMVNTAGMYGNLRGIAGSTVPMIEELEEESE